MPTEQQKIQSALLVVIFALALLLALAITVGAPPLTALAQTVTPTPAPTPTLFPTPVSLASGEMLPAMTLVMAGFMTLSTQQTGIYVICLALFALAFELLRVILLRNSA